MYIQRTHKTLEKIIPDLDMKKPYISIKNGGFV